MASSLAFCILAWIQRVASRPLNLSPIDASPPQLCDHFPATLRAATRLLRAFACRSLLRDHFVALLDLLRVDVRENTANRHLYSGAYTVGETTAPMSFLGLYVLVGTHMCNLCSAGVFPARADQSPREKEGCAGGHASEAEESEE